MNQKKFNLVIGYVFAIIAILHALRLMYGWVITIGEPSLGVAPFVAPMWVSIAGAAVAGFLSWSAFNLSNKK